jgi:hypothetical protein
MAGLNGVSRGEAPRDADKDRNVCEALHTQKHGEKLSLNQPNRRVRTRTHGGVGGEEPRGSPLSRLANITCGVM